MLRNCFYCFMFLLVSCASLKPPGWPRSTETTGTAYYQQAAAMNWQERDSITKGLVLNGNMPDFLRRFVPVRVKTYDSIQGKQVRLIFWVSLDYLSVGTNSDWARVHVSARLAQQIVDSLNCFLPTTKMVDLIYCAAKVKLAPVPMYAFRDSTPTFWQHHLIVEGQRKGRKGLIAGIQKDIVQTNKLPPNQKNERVAIYGWHRLNSIPIQPLYTGHAWWYVDYSHGVRLIYERLRVNGKWMHYKEVLNSPVLRKMICDEENRSD